MSKQAQTFVLNQNNLITKNITSHFYHPLLQPFQTVICLIFIKVHFNNDEKKSRIRETKNISTNMDSSTNIQKKLPSKAKFT